MIVIGKSLSYESRPEYMYFFLEGERTLTNLLSWWQDIYSITKDHNQKKILVDHDFHGSISHDDVLDFVTELEYKGFKEMVIALVDKNLETNKHLQYADAIAQISGFTSKLFNEAEQAVEWLKSTPIPSTE